MKKIETFAQTIIDLEFKPYQATFRNTDCYEVVIMGFSNVDINEAIEQAELALYDYLFKLYDELGLTDCLDNVYKSYTLCEIKIV